MSNLPLLLFIAGLVLFVAGDAMWLIRNTFKRPMNVKMTGGLVGAGVLLMVVGLGILIATAG